MVLFWQVVRGLIKFSYVILGNIVKTIEDEFVLKIYDWGVVEYGISCILQLDIDGTMDETSQKSYTSSLKL